MKRRLWFLLPFAAQMKSESQIAEELDRKTVLVILDSLGKTAQALEVIQNDQHKLHAIQAKITEVTGAMSDRIRTLEGRGDVHLVKPKPANNICPVCGTAAQPFKWEPTSQCDDTALVSIDLATGKQIYKIACEKPDKVPPNLTRCTHCNSAFWQDAI